MLPGRKAGVPSPILNSKQAEAVPTELAGARCRTRVSSAGNALDECGEGGGGTGGIGICEVER